MTNRGEAPFFSFCLLAAGEGPNGLREDISGFEVAGGLLAGIDSFVLNYSKDRFTLTFKT